MRTRKQLVKSALKKSRTYAGKNPARYITVHQTGNTNRGANAAAHANLQSNGNARSASWHWTVDDSEAVQSYPHTDRCWHAGDGRGDGNMSSIAIEICVNRDGNYKQALANAAKLVAQIMAAEGISLSRVVQHNHWSGKNCPSQIRAGQAGINWAGFRALVTDAQSGIFKDVKPSHKFAADIAWLKDAGITNGWSDGTFRPKDAVTREAMAAFLYRLAGRPAVKLPAKSPFRDVKAGSQFYREIVWLADSRITTGYADGTFRPKANIARDAMAAFLYRASGTVFTPPSKPTFKDVPKSAQFYREIEWLRSEGITTGYAGRKYKPYEPISREATAAFLHRYSN